MKIIIQFPNEKLRNAKLFKKVFEQFVAVFNYLDICVDLTNVKRELMLVKEGKLIEKNKKENKCPFCGIGIYNRNLMFRIVGKKSRSQLRRMREANL
jgi:hypothetical protein